MKKLMLSWTLVLAVAGLTFISCKKDKDDKPNNPGQSTIKDERDGKEYKTVTIGTQTWFAENLSYSGTLSKGNSYDPSGSKDSTAKYGKLYNWDGANVACPNGWRLPTDLDFRTLENFLGMSDSDTAKVGYSQERGADKSIGLKLQNGGGTGFNFIISGVSSEEVWTASKLLNGEIYVRGFYKNDKSIYRGKNVVGTALCVRCLKN